MPLDLIKGVKIRHAGHGESPRGTSEISRWWSEARTTRLSSKHARAPAAAPEPAERIRTQEWCHSPSSAFLLIFILSFYPRWRLCQAGSAAASPLSRNRLPPRAPRPGRASRRRCRNPPPQTPEVSKNPFSFMSWCPSWCIRAWQMFRADVKPARLSCKLSSWPLESSLTSSGATTSPIKSRTLAAARRAFSQHRSMRRSPVCAWQYWMGRARVLARSDEYKRGGTCH